MKKVALVLLVPVLLVASATLGDEAEYKRWKLDIDYGTPDYVALEDALGNSYLVWYQTIKVTNDTDQKVPLQVKVTATTDSGKTYRGTVDPIARKALQKKTGKTYKSATDLYKGELASKASIDAVVFYGKTDLEWDTFTVKISGLVDPIDKVKGKMFFEKKVLVLTFSRPGDEFGRASDPVSFKGSKWVIEGERKEIPQTEK